jgi:nucleoside 2-deoxyribosyltransferase
VSKIYLASPYGFAPSTRGFLQKMKSTLKKHGHQVIDPWEEGDSLFKASRRREGHLSPEKRVDELNRLNHQIAERNRQAIESVDVVVAVLDGPDVDSGTASEIGFAFACGKTIFGYRGDIRLIGENEATLVNLQVQYWIEESGGRKGRLVRTVPDILMALDALVKNS